MTKCRDLRALMHVGEMSRFTHFAGHKILAAGHLQLFCTPDSGLEALPQAAVAALVPLILVHCAVARKPTAVCMLLSNTPSKKSFAAVARSCSIVFSCSSVSTYGTVGWNDSTLQMVTIIHLCILKYNWNYCQHSFLILT